MSAEAKSDLMKLDEFQKICEKKSNKLVVVRVGVYNDMWDKMYSNANDVQVVFKYFKNQGCAYKWLVRNGQHEYMYQIISVSENKLNNDAGVYMRPVTGKWYIVKTFKMKNGRIIDTKYKYKENNGEIIKVYM